MSREPFGWLDIVRLGLVQTALGAVVVLTTSTLNRVMVVELALPAMLPGALVALHYAVQVSRPRWGYGSDVGGRRTPWIVGGMIVLATGGILAACATAWMETSVTQGIFLAVSGFLCIGVGVGAAGTSLLALLAKRVEPRRRAAAATIVWLMMIAGFVVTATTAGYFLDPYTPVRLVSVVATAASVAVLLTIAAVWNVEGGVPSPVPPNLSPAEANPRGAFSAALRQVWHEPQSRRFALFVFVAMLAYSAQDLILEPYAGAVFGYTIGESTRLAGVQHGGVFLGMLLVAGAVSGLGEARAGSLRAWTIGGCIASGVALGALAGAAYIGPAWPLATNVFCLGIANGVFAVAAIASMMTLAGSGRATREGTRMGLWGAAQAIAFGLGGFGGTLLVDVARALSGAVIPAYASVFAIEAVLFVVAALLAMKLNASARAGASRGAVVGVDGAMARMTGG